MMGCDCSSMSTATAPWSSFLKPAPHIASGDVKRALSHLIFRHLKRGQLMKYNGWPDHCSRTLAFWNVWADSGFH